MPFREITDAEQLALLTTVLDNYCQEKGIEATDPSRDELGRFLLTLFSAGTRNPKKLMASLDEIAERRQLSSK